MTVWEIDYSLPLTQELKKLIGDEGEARQGAFMNGGGVYGGQIKQTVFNPQIATWVINMFCPDNAMVYDPFAGGGTRAIISAAKGHRYIGLEIRQAEVDATRARIERLGYKSQAAVIQGDARFPPPWIADFLFTCPPYFDLEQYGGPIGDLSMIDVYPLFVWELGRAIRSSFDILTPGSKSVWVVGLHRDKNGYLLDIPGDVVRKHQECGFKYVDSVIIYHKNTGSKQRLGNFEKGKRRLIRTHEYALIFEKPLATKESSVVGSPELEGRHVG
jgi:hypothetical protein